MTKREQILEAILTKLKTIAGPDIPATNITRSRVNPFNARKMPIISLEPSDDPVKDISIPHEDRDLFVRIKIWAKGEVPDSAADKLVDLVGKKMREDLTLGGLIMDLSEVGTGPFDFEDGEDPFVMVQMAFKLQYRNLTL